MKKYKTGECYSEFCIKNEFSVMNFSKNCADIFILKKSPDKNLIDKITNTSPFFQIYTKNNIIFLLLQFENLDWIDIPYIHKGKMPDIIKDETLGYLCKIFFIDTLFLINSCKKALMFFKRFIQGILLCTFGAKKSSAKKYFRKNQFN